MNAMKKIEAIMFALCLSLIAVPAFRDTAFAAKQEPAKTYYGDVDTNGEVTAEDALLVLKHVVKLSVIEEELPLILADMTGDEAISSEDALEILKTVVNLTELREYVAPQPTETPTPTPDPTPTPEPVEYYIPEAFQETTDEVLGFPGADGFGKRTTGGRGGQVYEVTNLNDSGPGSLREAIDATGPRIVVFKVSGTIYLNSRLTIDDGDITIAGQTAPGDGICLANHGLVITRTSNVIVRYIRVRPGDHAASEQVQEDAIWVQACKDVILDHCSASWATDETLSVSPAGSGVKYEDVSDRVSVQWCAITESIRLSRQVGTRHGMGSLIRGAHGASVTFHHNYYASHSSRLPMMGNYMDNESQEGDFNMEFINNVVYNWSGNSSGKCADADANGIKVYTTNINYINNVFKKGPDSRADFAFSEACIGNKMYISGNQMNGEIPEDQKTLVKFEADVLEGRDNPYYRYDGTILDQEAYFVSAPFAHSIMANIQEPADVERDVVAGAGTSLFRDEIDTGIFDAYYNGRGRTINNPGESLGWTGGKIPNGLYDEEYYEYMQGKYPFLYSFTGYEDSDHDGMSDKWEEFMNLDPDDPKDGAEYYNGSKYTNLDVFLQFVIENPYAATAEWN